jgi:uncharacterized tellurite resistance protein B-like protein
LLTPIKKIKREVAVVSFACFLYFKFKNNILAKNTNLMPTFEEKRSLLLEMIAFSTVDGQLHKKEYEFLSIVANELNIEKDVFKDLFHQEIQQLPIKSEFQRIQQFYRLALLMHCDGVLHKKESQAIQQIAIDMGLNPLATKRILKLMNEAPNAMIPATVLLNIFQEQQN